MLYRSSVFSSNPRVELIEHFITPDLCSMLIDLGKQKLSPSLVMDREGGEAKSERRTSSHAWIAHSEAEYTKALGDRISRLVGIPLSNAESFQLVNYQPDQEYQPHFDSFHPESVSGAVALERAGQRLTTALLYLNTVKQGGQTVFPELDLKFSAQAGNLLIFQNCLPGTADRHPKSLHAGMPVIEGDKWVINLWFRQRVFK